jgi:hypothetical protein
MNFTCLPWRHNWGFSWGFQHVSLVHIKLLNGYLIELILHPKLTFRRDWTVLFQCMDPGAIYLLQLTSYIFDQVTFKPMNFLIQLNIWVFLLPLFQLMLFPVNNCHLYMFHRRGMIRLRVHFLEWIIRIIFP